MNKPYVICHMVISIDGKVTGKFLYDENSFNAVQTYYKLHKRFKADAFACGRVTMEESFTHKFYPNLKKYKTKKIFRVDFIANNKASFYAVCFDRKGKLGWKDNKIIDDDSGYNNAHIIEVLTETVKDEYLCYLQSKKISYIFAGKRNININIALDKLKNLFNIDKLLLEGGSIINGAFLDSNNVDELSLVVCPSIGDKNDKSLFFNSKKRNFKLEKSSLINGVIHQKYIKGD